MLKEAKRLHDLGFAIIWIKPKSKAPVRSGWTAGPRTPWAELEKSYVQGYNVGVRTGSASKIGARYLACIDVDIKDPSFAGAALAKLSEIIGTSVYPQVASGSGNDSRHLYCLTDQSFKMVTVAKVPHKWEICIYSDGRQMVLPPSVHPSGGVYKWSAPWTSIPVLKMKGLSHERTSPVGYKGGVSAFVATQCDLQNKGVPQALRALIVDGDGCEDRSAALYGVTVGLVRAGLSDAEILCTLTTPEFYLGQTAYDHARTKDRARAAAWVRKFTLDKVRAETGASTDFGAEYVAPADLSETQAVAQFDEMVEKWADWRLMIERTDEGRAKQTLQNVYRILQGEVGDGVFIYDEFANCDFYGCDTPWGGKKGCEVTDRDVVRIKAWFASQWRIEPSSDKINEAIVAIGDRNRFHPVRDYLESITWDGVPRLDTWLRDYHGGQGPEPYLSSVSRKVLVAMAARVYRPGVKFDQVLILEGRQGCGKSTAVRILAGDAWFTDAYLDLKNKDAPLSLRSKWVLEMGELVGLRRSDVETLKAFISTQADYIRAPYGRRHETHPRQCIFIGTTNNDEYLKDLTGNRRFWPVKVGQCDFNKLKADRDQLLAEAKVAFEFGEPLYLDETRAQAQAQSEQEGRVAEDIWVEKINDFLNNPNEGFPKGKFTSFDLFQPFGPLGSCSNLRSEQMRASDALKVLGFTKQRARDEKGYLKWYWIK